MLKKYCHLPFVVFFLLSFVVFFCIPTVKILAFTLNADYPTLPNGTTISSQSSIPEYLKYVFDIGMFAGGIALIISLAIAGVYYFLSPAMPGMLGKAKERLFGAFAGFLILLSVYLIITTINPGLSFFNISQLPPLPNIPEPKQPPQPGTYLYKNNNCSGSSCSKLAIRTAGAVFLASVSNTI